jgi:tight adherence protein C
MTDVWISFAFFLFVLLAIVAGGYILLMRPSAMADPGRTGGRLDAGSLETEADGSLFGRAFESVGSLVPAARKADNPIRRQLAQAGYYDPSALAIFYGLRCAAGLTIAALFAFAASMLHGEANAGILPAAGGAGLGFMMPSLLLRRSIRGRRARLRRGLPTALDLCVLSLEAGQSLDQALIEASRGLQRSFPDLSTELQMAVLEARASNDRTEALRNLAARSGDTEIRKFAVLLNDADRFGGSTAPAVRNHARYLRIRMKQQAQEAARKVSVKLIFPVFFLIFPSVLLVTLGPAVIMVMTQLHGILSR